MRLIVSCFISIMLVFNTSYAGLGGPMFDTDRSYAEDIEQKQGENSTSSKNGGKTILDQGAEAAEYFDSRTAPALKLPNANNLFNGQDNAFINSIDTSMGTGLSQILLLVLKVGYAVAIAVTLILAIKLMLTSPAKKAEAKAAALPYIIGLLLVVAGVKLATIVIEAYTKLL